MKQLLLLVALVLSAGTMPAHARGLNTLDARFTICAWGKITGCELLDQERLKQPNITRAERALIRAVMARVEGRAFDLPGLIAEFGPHPMVDTKSMPGITVALWTRDTPRSDKLTTISFTAEKGRIQIAGFVVPGKYTVRWCNRPDS